MLNDGKIHEVATTLVNAIVKTGTPSVRIHDSGDFWRPDYIKVWKEVAERLPHISFWAPTRSWVKEDLLPLLVDLNTLPNVSIRPSALKWNDAPPVVPGLAAGTTGHTTEDHKDACPATKIKGGKCYSINCNTCWEKNREVSYKRHVPPGGQGTFAPDLWSNPDPAPVRDGDRVQRHLGHVSVNSLALAHQFHPPKHRMYRPGRL